MKKKAEGSNPLKVRILDSEYRIKRKGEEDSYYEKIARYVDHKMRAIADKSSLISIDKLAILAALRICEELFRAKEEHEERDRILDKKLEEMAETIQSAIR